MYLSYSLLLYVHIRSATSSADYSDQSSAASVSAFLSADYSDQSSADSVSASVPPAKRKRSSRKFMGNALLPEEKTDSEYGEPMVESKSSICVIIRLQ